MCFLEETGTTKGVTLNKRFGVVRIFPEEKFTHYWVNGSITKNGFVKPEICGILNKNFNEDRGVVLYPTNEEPVIFKEPFNDENCTTIKDENSGKIYYY